MALLLDEAHWHWRGRLWCHLVSDTSLHELHAFAEWIGIPRRAFQGDHYDIPEEVRSVAIEEAPSSSPAGRSWSPSTPLDCVVDRTNAGSLTPPPEGVTGAYDSFTREYHTRSATDTMSSDMVVMRR